MEHKLIITESRTVAKAIAQAFGANILYKGYFEKGSIAVTWTGGNIITATPKSRFQFSVCSDMSADETFAANFNFNIRKDNKGKGVKGNHRPGEKDMAQVRVIEKLWRNATVVYNAMKPSASGEIIFTSLYNYMAMPRVVSRMWLRSITRQAILEAFESPEALPAGYAGFHDNAIAEYTIGVKPADRVNDSGNTSAEKAIWSMSELKYAGAKYRNWSSAKTTGVAYSLYNKGLISYPSEEKATLLPESAKDSIIYCITNLIHHPVLGKKTKEAVVSGKENIWGNDGSGRFHHGVTPTGLYPVNLTPDEEYLYNIIASHCLDVFIAGNQLQ